ncbi:S-methyl-5-thioribose kinase [Yersinia kristensenii]|uniref:Methylthioribose kinase n=1 Tax=Yersinia kristensenii TaxID=28152 RepID=A0A0T9M4Q4_YERKR|nr:S-methyl-5-thioribose kinase [Yersinia kristensenii]MDA5473370.1 S-methyl-5-thioribose kinase [Yersinia kristensenii]MDA5478087.1 S-methyl-5-thioribose kinase [Yersinia kristensenii]MDA5508800.1 S-methyl-5-thioribose kinase [Yersinia kristensenii]MDA5524882.1 S-methyl-5-thioribose kinase [Yersinia kristensenii]MDR4896917.1 S-methyl-5-thioribose kinase [Yersinia kristensenii]
MSRYHTFTAADAVEYARQFGQVADPLTLVTADEIGDGNLNLVFKIRDAAGISRVIVKQALPYVRCVGESWPLTLDRARIEAETLLTHSQFCPQHTVNVLHHDAELAVMVQEDLSDHQIWRSELVKGKYYPQAAGQLAEYLAQTLFHTSDFYQSAQAKKAAVSRYTNPELCQITEDLFFTDPYIDHERNNFDPALLADVLVLRQDNALKLAVASLKHRFLSKAEAHLHGDIHSGSIFVADGRLKAIDAEFGFYGPIGFDIGTALGNLLLNYCGLPGLAGPRDAAAGREQRLKDIHILWETFASRFLALSEEKTQDSTLATAGYAQLFLQQVWQDAVGYCGSELIRRTIGLAHVADLDSIVDDEMRRACQRHVLSLGRTLILAAPHIDSVDDLIARIRQNG